MPFADPDVPTPLNDLALYASLVATAVIVLNVVLVKLARSALWFRTRNRGRNALRYRRTRP